MAIRRYSPIHSFFQQIASSPFGTWLFYHTARTADGIFLKLSSGRLALTTLLTGLPVLILTAIGAKSGLPRSLPLVFVRDPLAPEKLAIVATNFGNPHHPAWYFNLKANPRAMCAINGEVKAYIAHEVQDVEYDRLWQCASEAYIGYPRYKVRAGKRHIPIMVLTPENSL